MKSKMTLIFLCLAIAVIPSTAQQNTTWKPIDDAMGRAGQDQPDGVRRYSMPRSDLNVTAEGVQIKAGLALGSWAAFHTMANQSEVMGDLVLTDSEVNPVMQKLISSNLEITALHNHLLNESPHVMYMHIHGKGDPVKLASAIRDALSLTKTPPAAPTAATAAQDIGIDTKQIDSILGYAGKNNNGIYQFSVPRAETIMDGGMAVPNSMGVATAINFQPTGGGKAAITGDFVLTSKEVNPVIKALKNNGIGVTAVHSHMLDEQPRLFFMHFWANDDALKLAKGLRAAVDQTNSAKTK
jgi:hypothetical protein